MRWPGVEPGSIAWKATMLTVTPPTLTCGCLAKPPFCLVLITIVLTSTHTPQPQNIHRDDNVINTIVVLSYTLVSAKTSLGHLVTGVRAVKDKKEMNLHVVDIWTNSIT